MLRQGIQHSLVILLGITAPPTQKAFVFRECFSFKAVELSCKVLSAQLFWLVNLSLGMSFVCVAEGGDGGDGRVGGPWHPGDLCNGHVKVRWGGLVREIIKFVLSLLNFLDSVSNSYVPSSFLGARAGPASDKWRRGAPAAAGAGHEPGGGGAGQCPCRFPKVSML